MADTLPHTSSQAHEEAQPEPLTWCLVTGAPRSGTSVLRAMVDDHPQAAILQEYGLTRLAHGLDSLVGRPMPIRPPWAPFADVSTPLGRAAAYYADRDARGGAGSVGELRDLGFDGLARAVFTASSGKPQLRVVGDKLPIRGEWENVHQLGRWLPGLKILVVLRDPAAVIRSSMVRRARQRQGGDIWPIESVQEAADEWWMSMQRTAELVDWFGSDVHLLTYEALCAEPSRALDDVWRWLDLPPHASRVLVESRPDDDDLDPGEPEIVASLVGALSELWRLERNPRALLEAARAAPRPLQLSRRHLASATHEEGLFGEGFSWREDWGRWSDGDRAILHLRHGLLHGQALLEIDVARAFTTAGRPCDVVVRPGSGAAQLFSLGDGVSRIAMLCDLSASPAPGTLDVELRILWPKGVLEAPADERRLGVGVEAVTLTPTP